MILECYFRLASFPESISSNCRVRVRSGIRIRHSSSGIPGEFRRQAAFSPHTDTQLASNAAGTIVMSPTFLAKAFFPLFFFILLADCVSFQHSMSEMGDKALDWLQDKSMNWIRAPPATKIDTHHHYVPSFYSTGELCSYCRSDYWNDY